MLLHSRILPFHPVETLDCGRTAERLRLTVMRWALRTADENAIRVLTSELKLSPIVARLLAARGIVSPEQAQQFLAPVLSHLHSPYAMLGMKAAVDRLQVAIAHKEPILIYGDYDVDG